MKTQVRITRNKVLYLDGVADVIENVSKRRLTVIFESGEEVTFLAGAWRGVQTEREKK